MVLVEYFELSIYISANRLNNDYLAKFVNEFLKKFEGKRLMPLLKIKSISIDGSWFTIHDYQQLIQIASKIDDTFKFGNLISPEVQGFISEKEQLKKNEEDKNNTKIYAKLKIDIRSQNDEQDFIEKEFNCYTAFFAKHNTDLLEVDDSDPDEPKNKFKDIRKNISLTQSKTNKFIFDKYLRYI